MKITTLQDNSRIVVTDSGEAYQYYKAVGRATDRPWCLVRQKGAGKLEWFTTEEEVIEFIEKQP